MAMTREHWGDRLSEYLDGELSAPEADRLEAHLAECSDCAATLDDLRAVMVAAAALGGREPERDLWPGIAARLRPRAAIPPAPAPVLDLGSARERRRGVTLSVPQLVAAALALVLFSGTAVWVVVGQRPGNGPAVAEHETAASTPVSFAASYEATIADLEREFEQRRPALDPATVLVVERNLAIIDEAIDEARRALAADPQSGFLSGYVEDALRRKVQLLRQATGIHRTIS